MFKSGYEVEMIGLTPLLLSAEEECPSALVIVLALVNTNARRDIITNMNLIVLCLLNSNIPFIYKNVKT
jgi:hypothetical protein